MIKRLRLIPIMIACMLASFSAAWGAVTFTLSISPASINFPDNDPDAFPASQASGVTITVDPAGIGGSAVWYLHVLARGNLVSGSSTIPISNISWTSTNQPKFKNGSMTTSVPGTLVAQSTGGTAETATVTFSLQNLWTYSTGTYAQTVDFTATSP